MTLRHCSHIGRGNQRIITVVSLLSWLDMSGNIRIGAIGVKARYLVVKYLLKNERWSLNT